jgi:hypothetical protein
MEVIFGKPDQQNVRFTRRVWHQEPFDYIVRSPAQLARFEEYIQKNPNSLPFSQRPD